MNDIEFAQSVSPEIAGLYAQAKDLAFITPGYALTHLRSFAAVFCDEIEPSAKADSNIANKIVMVRNAQGSSRKALSALKTFLQESIKQQIIEIAVLNTRLTQSQTNLIYIQEHVSTLDTGNDELRQIISAQTLSASSLADSLAKANLELRKCMKSKMPVNKNK